MNTLKGTIKNIKNHEGITQILVDVDGKTFSSLILGDEEEYKIGQNVHLLFKESEVMIATKESSVSARNSFISHITNIQRGEILSQVEFDFDGKKIISIVTKDATNVLKCEAGDLFMWFVKSTEISIQKG